MSSLSKFELRIIFAITASVIAPLIASLIFIPQLIQARFAELSHSQVKTQLENHAVFYGDFFDAKKKEFSATARALAKDPLLREIIEEGEPDAAGVRLDRILEDHPEIQMARIRGSDGTTWVERGAPPAQDVRPKTLVVPLRLGDDAPQLELTFILSQSYFDRQAKAEEVALLYDASLQTFGRRFAEKQRTYYVILAAVALVALGFGFWLARAVTRRVAALAAATERVGRGELEFQIPVTGGDEIAELSARFNRMLQELQEAQRRIIDLEKISGWQDFARKLAHEIKNPLTPIRLAVHELKRRAPAQDPEFERLVADAAEVVEDETKRLTKLVNEFSQFAKLPDIAPEMIDLSEFLQDFIRAYSGQGQVYLRLPDGPVEAVVDRDQLRQVLHNLVINAIQASDRPDTRIDIELSASPRGPRRLAVQDDGPGIPESVADKLFEPYYTTKAQGTGLGLAIAKKIILQHGGSIRSANRPEGGARFTIVLPAPGEASSPLPRPGAIDSVAG